MDRRQLLGAGGVIASGALAAAPASAAQPKAGRTGPPPKFLRIATEEAWSIPEHVNAMAAAGRTMWDNLDAEQVRGMNTGAGIGKSLVDTADRLREMDALGVDMHLLSLTSPGVQMFDADTAVGMAALANDRMAEIVRGNPSRFAGLASFSPQDPKRAVIEMDRAINKLKLNGFVVNSHTGNQYLDEQKFWPILEAAEALNAPIYIHPRCPADNMAAQFRTYRMQAAIWGYAIETGTHAVRLMLSGVFDRFPNLKIVLGHMGENIPFHLWRTDHFYFRRRDSYPSKLSPMEVFKRNFYITTSGVEHGPALRYAIEVLGADRVMWAIDYPYEQSAPSVKFMNEVEIPDADKALVFGANAQRIFNIRRGG